MIRTKEEKASVKIIANNSRGIEEQTTTLSRAMADAIASVNDYFQFDYNRKTKGYYTEDMRKQYTDRVKSCISKCVREIEIYTECMGYCDEILGIANKSINKSANRIEKKKNESKDNA